MILLNAFRDQYNRGKKHAHIQAHNGVEITQGSLAQSAPDHQFEERKLIELVRSAAEKHQINPGWVGLFIDVYFYHMEYKEAAEKYAVPIGTVMSRLHRTSKQILDAIQKYHPILHTHLTSLIRQKKDATTP